MAVNGTDSKTPKIDSHVCGAFIFSKGAKIQILSRNESQTETLETIKLL